MTSASTRRVLLLTFCAALGGGSAAGFIAGPAFAAPATPPANPPTASPTASPTAAPAVASNPVAVIAVLDKREGVTADFTLKPGESFHFRRLTGTMRTCETTPPYERKQSAAFVQVVDQPPTLRGRAPVRPTTVFSGWLFAESPSLNPFIHPVYDVWLKSCTMRFPEGPSAPARKSATTPRAAPSAPAAPAAAPAEPSAN